MDSKTEPASEAKKRPDFPQWIETKDGKDCLAWPISEVKYLHNRLFWAFDAGRNCVWDQYISQKEEITRLKAELERERELRKEILRKAFRAGRGHERNIQWPSFDEWYEINVLKS